MNLLKIYLVNKLFYQYNYLNDKYMPLVKDFIEGSVSDKTYTSELHPKVVNSSKSPLDSASDKIQQLYVFPPAQPETVYVA